MHHKLLVTKWEWTQWMFLYFMVSGICSLVTMARVQQPPVLTTPLGQDVLMPCQLYLSKNEQMRSPPVLYWERLMEDGSKPRLWSPSEKYTGRVNLLDSDQTSSNKSILFKGVHWADSGKYQCKLSITTDKSFRERGNETLLLVYDAMTFNITTQHNHLLCEVNVTRDPAFVLSIFHDARKLQTVEYGSGNSVTNQPYVTLSESASPTGHGQYECQLHLNTDLITKSILHYQPVEVGDAENNVSVTDSTNDGSVAVSPEPWLLYVALLLVPLTILLGLLTVLLVCRC